MRLIHKRIFPSLLALLALRLSGQPATNANLCFAPIPPCPALLAAAQTNGIPLEGIAPPTPGGSLLPGDSVTALIALFEKGARQTQWLLHLQAVAPDAKEQSAKPSPPMVMYTTTGQKLEFASSPAFVTLHALGPFIEPGARRKSPKTLDQSAHFALNQDFLGLGLDKATTVILRLNDVKQPGMKGFFSVAGKSFSDAEVRAGRKLADTLKLTDDEQRALAGLGPALMSYFSIVQQTSGLEEILFKILDLPSLWSVLRHGGVKTFFRVDSKNVMLGDAAGWGLSTNAPLYHLPLILELNDQPALNITLAVTLPQPPLLACAGVVGMIAAKPGDKERHLAVRIVSASCAAREK